MPDLDFLPQQEEMFIDCEGVFPAEPELEVVVVEGRTRIAPQDIQKIAVGSVLELGSRQGDRLQVCANGLPIANGRIVGLPNGQKGIEILDVYERNQQSLHRSYS